MKEILNRKEVIGILEWWNSGSIINKPKFDFQAIIVIKRKASGNSCE